MHPDQAHSRSFHWQNTLRDTRNGCCTSRIGGHVTRIDRIQVHEWCVSCVCSSWDYDTTLNGLCTAVGLMVLLYDHVLTFGDEVQYVWSAPATYAKYIFLLNRYVVLGTLLAVAYGEQNSRVMGTCVSTMIHRDVRLRGFNVHRRGMYCFNLYPGHVIILNIILIAQGSVAMNIWTVD